MNCPLCLKSTITHYHKDNLRDYWQCNNCHLVFVDSKSLLNANDEKAIYDLHENSSDDIGYRNFLNKLLVPLINMLKPGAKGLDFGSGSGPTIKIMMEEKGFKVNNFDLYYAHNPEIFDQTYDFITCTEVIEHLYLPHDEISMLNNILSPGGYFGIMTKRLINKDKFKSWHYKNDPTHVCFYSDETFEFMASYWGFELNIINSDTVIFKKIK